MSNFQDAISRLAGKFRGEFTESEEKVPTLPRNVPIANSPEFMKSALREHHTKYYKGNPEERDIAYVPAGTTKAIYVVHPELMNRAIRSHEGTHIYQSTLRDPMSYGKESDRMYDYGGWQGLLDARSKGKHIRDFTDEQQAQMIEDYVKLQDLLHTGDFKGEPPLIQKYRLEEWDKANQALGPFLHELATQPKESESKGTRFNPEKLDLKPPPAPGPPPAALTGQAVPLPDIGGTSVFTEQPTTLPTSSVTHINFKK